MQVCSVKPGVLTTNTLQLCYGLQKIAFGQCLRSATAAMCVFSRFHDVTSLHLIASLLLLCHFQCSHPGVTGCAFADVTCLRFLAGRPSMVHVQCAMIRQSCHITYIYILHIDTYLGNPEDILYIHIGLGDRFFKYFFMCAIRMDTKAGSELSHRHDTQ